MEVKRTVLDQWHIMVGLTLYIQHLGQLFSAFFGVIYGKLTRVRWPCLGLLAPACDAFPPLFFPATEYVVFLGIPLGPCICKIPPVQKYSNSSRPESKTQVCSLPSLDCVGSFLERGRRSLPSPLTMSFPHFPLIFASVFLSTMSDVARVEEIVENQCKFTVLSKVCSLF